MKVLHISTSDTRGGAAIAAYRQHIGLGRIGVASKLLVAHRRSGDENVCEAPPSTKILDRLRYGFDRKRFLLERRAYARTKSPFLELFSDDRVPGANLLSHVPDADILNLHWTSGLLDYRKFFSGSIVRKPLVWTLHDMNPITGGCHYALGCDKFADHCGSCPQLGSKYEKDLSWRIHFRKSTALANQNPEITRIVADSKWLAREAKRSSLLGRFDVRCIHYGLDTEVFQPRDRALARQQLGLPQESQIILFAADSVVNHRKGLDLLSQALFRLPSERRITLCAIGSKHSGERLPGDAIALGRIDDPQRMALAYSAADIFVAPSRAEAFGQVALEAMACGVPVVAFAVGGLVDIVRQDVTGLLASPENVNELREAVLLLLDDPLLRSRMSIESRRVVLEEFALERQATRYQTLYGELIEAAANRGAKAEVGRSLLTDSNR